MKRRQNSQRPKQNPHAPLPLPRWKLWLLRLVALAGVPVIILALIELALRLAGFGYPTAFLLRSSNHGSPTFVQNDKFGWRFFGKRMSRSPAAISILQNKPPGMIRIFVFGESAAFGDPQPAFGLPRVLQAMLSLRHPGIKFEVVNAAMTAINSHVIRDIAHDCAKAGGDIWVIYMGNNEVVGPFGAGTVFGSQAPPLFLIRETLALKTTRIGQLIDDARQQWEKPADDKSEWGGMRMFVNQEVAANDPRMANVYRNFDHNLADIIREGHDSGVGIVVSTVAVNLKDCAPFASAHRAGMSQSEVAQWDNDMKLGIQAQAAGNFVESVGFFRQASDLDNSSAELQFRLGRSLLELGNSSAARESLSQARDLDTLRFRCDNRLNELTRKAVTGRQADRILLADAERSFAEAASNGLPGWDFFYEHVHLTFEGNFLLARTIAEQVEKLLPQSATPKPWPAMEDCARHLGRTDHDLHSALTEVLSRLTDPPFTSQLNHDEHVRFLIQEARKAAAGENLGDSLRATQTAIQADPDDPLLYEQLAALEQSAGQYANAEKAAQRAVDFLPSSEEAWSQLGYTFVEQKKFSDAAEAYQKAYDLNPQDVWPLQNLAMSLVKLGRNDEAMREYKRALAITPRFGLAWLGMGELLETEGHKDEAASCYQKALSNRIHKAGDLATLARFCMTRGWYEAASTNFSDAIKLDPTDPALRMEAGQAYFMRGIDMGKSGQNASAARQFQQAVVLMPDVLEARLNLGIALFKQGLWDDSRQQFQDVASRSPTNALALHYLELLQKRAQPGSQ